MKEEVAQRFGMWWNRDRRYHYGYAVLCKMWKHLDQLPHKEFQGHPRASYLLSRVRSDHHLGSNVLIAASFPAEGDDDATRQSPFRRGHGPL